MNVESSRLRIVGSTTAVVAVLALAEGVRLAAGTTTIGPTTGAAHFESDARALITLAAFAIAAASVLVAVGRNLRMIRAAAGVVAAAGVASLAEVWLCVGHWHAEATRTAVAAGYPASAVQNHYGRGIEVVVAGGLVAVVAAAVMAARAHTPPARRGIQAREDRESTI